jgi:hypothetical protein
MARCRKCGTDPFVPEECQLCDSCQSRLFYEAEYREQFGEDPPEDDGEEMYDDTEYDPDPWDPSNDPDPTPK